MIVYRANKAQFIKESLSGRIADYVYAVYKTRIGGSADSQISSWRSSLRAMGHVISDEAIPDDASVCVEYKLPNLGSRIDFLIAGKDEADNEHVVIVELKQWSDENVTPVVEMDLVKVRMKKNAEVLLPHPSYQAWSYAVMIQDYNETVQDENINLHPCSYLHSYMGYNGDKFLDGSCFDEINMAPVFTMYTHAELTDFIKKYIVKADDDNIMDRVDNGRIKPSKSLQNVIRNMLADNKQEFTLIDSQKEVFESIMHFYRKRILLGDQGKYVIIIKGGPGTGKTVVAINLLAKIIREGKNAAFVTKTSATREVYKVKLAKEKYKRVRIDKLFIGAGSFVEAETDSYDMLLVDESHRLAKKTLAFSKGENQIKEIVNAAKMSVFFIDEKQVVSAQDIGSIAEIQKYASLYGAEVHELELTSQFRCNGSDGYLAFLDNVLGIEPDKKYIFNPDEYFIKVCDDPNTVMQEIRRLDMAGKSARVVAGYCWEWASEDDRYADDIIIPDKNFKAQWNFKVSDLPWAINPDSVEQIGCIHTSQGLEFEYTGVIIGDDLRFENGQVITDSSKRAKSDKSLNGIKGLCNPKGRKKPDPEALKRADDIIKNTYRTLLSRGMKGTYIYCTDKALSEHIREKLEEARTTYESFRMEEQIAN